MKRALKRILMTIFLLISQRRCCKREGRAIRQPPSKETLRQSLAPRPNPSTGKYLVILNESELVAPYDGVKEEAVPPVRT